MQTGFQSLAEIVGGKGFGGMKWHDEERCCELHGRYMQMQKQKLCNTCCNTISPRMEIAIGTKSAMRCFCPAAQSAGNARKLLESDGKRNEQDVPLKQRHPKTVQAQMQMHMQMKIQMQC